MELEGEIDREFRKGGERREEDGVGTSRGTSNERDQNFD